MSCKATMRGGHLLLTAGVVGLVALGAQGDFANKIGKEVVGYGETRSTLANFPVLVRIPSQQAKECRADGADIQFTSSDGETIYPHEIDAWNPDGESTVWVKLPELKQGTTFIMKWGDAAYTGAEQEKGVVWSDAGYAAVWHMSEESGTVANVTANGSAMDAVPAGTRASYSKRVSDAPIGFARDTGAQDVNHNSNGRAFLKVASYDDLQLGSTFTISGWWKMTEYHGNYDGNHRTRNARMFSRKTAWNTTGEGFEFALDNSQYNAGVTGSTTKKVGLSGLPNSVGNWVHMAFVYNDTTVTVYANGEKKASGAIDPAMDCGRELGIGSNCGSWNGVYDNDSYAVGYFDEVRLQDLQSEVNYDDWFAAEYAMGSDKNFLKDNIISADKPVVSIAISGTTSREWKNESQTITLMRPVTSASDEIVIQLSVEGSPALTEQVGVEMTMPAGITSLQIPISIIDNTTQDGDLSLTVTVVAAEDYDVKSGSDTISLTVIDDESHRVVTNWVGLGDGTSWTDVMNWSVEAVPTDIDTVVFGDGVSADLSVVVPEESAIEMEKLIFTTANKVTLGAASAPAMKAVPVEVTEGAGLVTIATDFKFAEDTTLSVAKEAELDLRRIVGTKDFIQVGEGTIKLIAEGDRSEGKTIVKSGTLFVGANRQLGTGLVIGGTDLPAVVRSTIWGDAYPYASGGRTTEILNNGKLDLAADGQSGTWSKDGTGPILIRKGGTFLQGNRRLEFTAGVENMILEGTFVGATTTSFDFKDNSSLTVPSTAEAAHVIPTDMIVNTGVKVKVEDIPDAPVDLTLAGTISYGWHPRDAIHKTGTGVLRLTGKNTYGGGELNAGNGTTKVLDGTLLVDNTNGSGTGNAPVTVDGGAVLGGTGLIGGQTEVIKHWSGNTFADGSLYVHVTPKGTAEKQAVIWPGTIDAETGAHVNGTLTVGTADLHNPVHFGDYSTLKLTFGAGKDQADALVVNGAVDISATGTRLVLEPNGNVKQRAGTFTILSATDGITGDFAEVVVPSKTWKVNKVMGKVTTEEGEADAVVALTATVPGPGFVIIVK